MNKLLRIGELLVQAGLISQAQLTVALRDKGGSGKGYRLGEILALRGWIHQDTVDFFVRELSFRAQGSRHLKLGEYLILARLLTPLQVNQLLQEQEDSNIRLGSLAVSHGWIERQTLDFFLDGFFPRQAQEPDIQTVKSALSLAYAPVNSSGYVTLNPVDPIAYGEALEELVDDRLNEEDLQFLGISN